MPETITRTTKPTKNVYPPSYNKTTTDPGAKVDFSDLTSNKYTIDFLSGKVVEKCQSVLPEAKNQDSLISDYLNRNTVTLATPDGKGAKAIVLSGGSGGSGGTTRVTVLSGGSGGSGGTTRVTEVGPTQQQIQMAETYQQLNPIEQAGVNLAIALKNPEVALKSVYEKLTTGKVSEQTNLELLQTWESMKKFRESDAVSQAGYVLTSVPGTFVIGAGFGVVSGAIGKMAGSVPKLIFDAGVLAGGVYSAAEYYKTSPSPDIVKLGTIGIHGLAGAAGYSAGVNIAEGTIPQTDLSKQVDAWTSEKAQQVKEFIHSTDIKLQRKNPIPVETFETPKGKFTMTETPIEITSTDKYFGGLIKRTDVTRGVEITATLQTEKGNAILFKGKSGIIAGGEFGGKHSYISSSKFLGIAKTGETFVPGEEGLIQTQKTLTNVWLIGKEKSIFDSNLERVAKFEEKWNVKPEQITEQSQMPRYFDVKIIQEQRITPESIKITKKRPVEEETAFKQKSIFEMAKTKGKTGRKAKVDFKEGTIETPEDVATAIHEIIHAKKGTVSEKVVELETLKESVKNKVEFTESALQNKRFLKSEIGKAYQEMMEKRKLEGLDIERKIIYSPAEGKRIELSKAKQGKLKEITLQVEEGIKGRGGIKIESPKEQVAYFEGKETGAPGATISITKTDISEMLKPSFSSKFKIPTPKVEFVKMPVAPIMPVTISLPDVKQKSKTIERKTIERLSKEIKPAEISTILNQQKSIVTPIKIQEKKTKIISEDLGRIEDIAEEIIKKTKVTWIQTTRPNIKLPSLPRGGGGLGPGIAGFRIPEFYKGRTKYKPSLLAEIFGIKGEKTENIFGIRPIPKKTK